MTWEITAQIAAEAANEYPIPGPNRKKRVEDLRCPDLIRAVETEAEEVRWTRAEFFELSRHSKRHKELAAAG